MNRDRQIRVFISSTFRDMQAERDYLVKLIFPQLRKLCESRGVTWGEVDLRWGVTDEQAAEGKVLPICLEEIKRCRPYFIGLLAERYGWIPESIPVEVIEREPWLKEHLHGKKSVTELEIIHGVLREEQMHGQAFFYFRDPAFTESILPEQRQNFTTENAESAEKLRRLKNHIRKAQREEVCCLHENYPDPKALGELVLADLTRVIKDNWPEGSQPDPLDREMMEHEAYAKSRERVYIGRQEYFDRLNTHVAANDTQPLVILGESGSGKSALLANWVLRFRQAHPDALVLQHYIGGTPYSADWAAMLRRLMGELKRRVGIQQDIPDQPDALRSAFPNWLHMAAAKGRVVLVLDALNQLEDRDGALDLVWLPSTIPEHVRIVLSTLPGRALEVLKKRGGATLTIEPLQTIERQQLIADFLAQYAKAFSSAQTELIVRAPQTANPLYLHALLEELRLYGEHFTLEQRIDFYVAAATVPELYAKILERYEQDYDRDRPSLVQDTMSALWAARRGLSEADLLIFLGRRGEETLPHAIWSPLYLAADQVLINRGGVMGFSHEYLCDAVEKKYLNDDKSKLAIRDRLFLFCGHLISKFAAGKFDAALPRINRLVGELPWQLAQAGAWETLYDLLADPIIFGILWTTEPFEVRRYWAQLERNSQFRAIEAYRPVFEAPTNQEIPNHLEFVAELLTQLGHVNEGLLLYEYILQNCGPLVEPERRTELILQRADILIERGQSGRAIEQLTHLEDECRSGADQNGLEGVLISLGNALLAQRDFEGALEKYREQELLSRELGNKRNLALSFGNQALAIGEQMFGAEEFDLEVLDEASVERRKMRMDDSKLETALTLHLQEERLYLELGDPDGLQRCIGNQATIHAIRGDFLQAKELLTRKERICRDTNNNLSLVHCLLAIAQLNSLHFRNRARGFLQSLEACHIVEAYSLSRVESAARQCLRLALRARVVELQEQRGNPREELQELERCLRVAERYQWTDDAHMVRSMLNATKIAAKRQRLAEEFGISSGPGGEVMLPTSLLSNERFMQQWLAEGDDDVGALREYNAEPLRAERIHTDMLEDNLQEKEKSVEARSILLQLEAEQLNALARNMKSQGNPLAAINVLQNAREKWETAGNKSEVRWCLANQAILLQQLGRIDQALSVHKQEESLCRRLNDRSALTISLGNQALAYAAKGDFAKALELHKLEEDTCRELGDFRAIQISLGNQATVLIKLSDLDGAQHRLNEQENICRDTGDLDGLQRSLGNQGIIQLGRGNICQALALHREQERLARQIENPDGVANALINIAPLLAVQQQNQEALEAACEARQLATEFNLPQLLETAEFLEKTLRQVPSSDWKVARRPISSASSIFFWIFMFAVMLGAVFSSLRWQWFALIGVPVTLICAGCVVTRILTHVKLVAIVACAKCGNRAIRFGKDQLFCSHCSPESRDVHAGDTQ